MANTLIISFQDSYTRIIIIYVTKRTGNSWIMIVLDNCGILDIIKLVKKQQGKYGTSHKIRNVNIFYASY